MPSSNINNIFMSVNNSNFMFVFFKHACHANPGADAKCQDLIDKFRCIFLETFEIHLQAVMFLIEHISHDKYLDFLC